MFCHIFIYTMFLAQALHYINYAVYVFYAVLAVQASKSLQLCCQRHYKYNSNSTNYRMAHTHSFKTVLDKKRQKKSRGAFG